MPHRLQIFPQNGGPLFIGRPQNTVLSAGERERLLSLAGEDAEEELSDLLTEAEAAADPAVLFGVYTPEAAENDRIRIGGVWVESALAAEKLCGVGQCFPYVATAGRALEALREKQDGDPLLAFWTDEIQKLYLSRTVSAFFAFLKEEYHISGHLTALNPGSLPSWPLSGQRELFGILGGAAAVRDAIGVVCTESWLMLPLKSGSGIAFESGSLYENCQYCPQESCPHRRAPRIPEGIS